MSIKLNGATNGSIQLTPEAALVSDRVITLNATGNSTLTLPDANGTLDRLERAGNFLQVVQGSTETIATISTTSFTSIGLQASITPSSTSNKILIFVDINYQAAQAANNTGHGTRLKRGSTVIKAPVQGGGGPYEVWRRNIGVSDINYYDSLNYHILDSPGTTNSITYSVEGAAYDGGGTVHYQSNGSTQKQVSRITLIEVAG